MGRYLNKHGEKAIENLRNKLMAVRDQSIPFTAKIVGFGDINFYSYDVFYATINILEKILIADKKKEEKDGDKTK
jgi:hypothetical protein